MNSFPLHPFLFAFLTVMAFSPLSAHAIGAAADTEWPESATLEIKLKISATIDKEGHTKIDGHLIVTNPTSTPFTIQKTTNRLVLAFLVFDSLGNPVAPEAVGKTDPGFDTVRLLPHSTWTYKFETFNFITGSSEQSYSFRRGDLYRVIAVYRPAGPHGPGFTSHECNLQIPQ